MAAVASTKEIYAGQVEYFGANIDTAGDWLEVPAHASTYSVLVKVTGEDISFKLGVTCGYSSEGSWFPVDTEQTITEAGEYAYFFTGKAAPRVRVTLNEITTGEPVLSPAILVASNV
jgi:hypothetical protein